MQKILDLLALTLIWHDPGIDRHVGNRVIATDVFAIGQPMIQDTIETIGLVHVAIDRVLNLFDGIAREMMVLSRHRPETAHLPHQPLDDIEAFPRLYRQELAGLLRQINQNGAMPNRIASLK